MPHLQVEGERWECSTSSTIGHCWVMMLSTVATMWKHWPQKLQESSQPRQRWKEFIQLCKPAENFFIHNGCIYYLPPLTCNVPKMMESHFLHRLYHSHFLSVPSSAFSTCFWLVVAYKIVYHQPTKASMYFMHFICLTFDFRFDGPNDWMAPPHVLPPLSASPLAPPYSSHQLLG